VSESLRYCGRDFTGSDLEVVRALAASLPTRRAVADALCDALDWRRLDGRPKDMSARVALLRMADDGLVVLPAPRTTNANGRIARHEEAPACLPLELSGPLQDLGAIELVVVTTPAHKRHWRSLVATYHYLGYVPFAGAQLRYLVETPSGTVGALGFAASAWKCKPRDAHIGWDRPSREARLHLVVGNARFLVLPHVRVANLASAILGSVTRRLQADWTASYGYRPVLVETFVERDRFKGTSYRAANWQHVGHTQGRGKLDTNHERALPVKDVYLYPLQRNYRQVLSAPL
jgi:hypothetical protein